MTQQRKRERRRERRKKKRQEPPSVQTPLLNVTVIDDAYLEEVYSVMESLHEETGYGPSFALQVLFVDVIETYAQLNGLTLLDAAEQLWEGYGFDDYERFD